MTSCVVRVKLKRSASTGVRRNHRHRPLGTGFSFGNAKQGGEEEGSMPEVVGRECSQISKTEEFGTKPTTIFQGVSSEFDASPESWNRVAKTPRDCSRTYPGNNRVTTVPPGSAVLHGRRSDSHSRFHLATPTVHSTLSPLPSASSPICTITEGASSIGGMVQNPRRRLSPNIMVN